MIPRYMYVDGREIVRYVHEMGTFIGEEEGAGERKKEERELWDTTR